MNKRVQAFLAKMQEKELDGIIINNLKNVYYLTGFWGSNGTVFISRDRQVLVTDSRYIIAAKQESGFGDRLSLYHCSQARNQWF